jgi:DNA-directed RNA polymerase subunit alpha
MENILLPSTINYEDGERPNEGVLIVEPCYHGYGTTVGNALRRVLLSSLPGAAVTSVRIDGVEHEFQAIEDCKEDALAIILNLKDLRLKMHSEEPVTLKLEADGKGKVTAADIEDNSDIDVVNEDLEIASLTSDDAKLSMEMTVERGRGYSASEDREDEDTEIGHIAIDALFSPVRNVGYRVEDTRVGEITDYDKLIMTIETDGTVTPEEAVKEATKTLIDYFEILLQDELPQDEDEGGDDEEEEESDEEESEDESDEE